MVKIAIAPTTAGYTVGSAGGVVSQKLDGGAPRFRLDILGAYRVVRAQWTTGREGYQYLQAFFLTSTARGSLPFTIDLILDEPGLTEHTAFFVPDTYRLTGVKGLRHTVTASLYVVPLPRDADVDASLVDLYAIYGDNLGSFLNILEDTANQDVWGP